MGYLGGNMGCWKGYWKGVVVVVVGGTVGGRVAGTPGYGYHQGLPKREGSNICCMSVGSRTAGVVGAMVGATVGCVRGQERVTSLSPYSKGSRLAVSWGRPKPTSKLYKCITEIRNSTHSVNDKSHQVHPVILTVVSQQLPVNGAVTTSEPAALVSNVNEHWEHVRSRGCHDPSTKKQRKCQAHGSFNLHLKWRIETCLWL